MERFESSTVRNANMTQSKPQPLDSPFGESFSLPKWNVYSSSYIYSAQASLKGERAVFIRIGGIYPIWSKHASTCRTQASTDMKRADTISDTDSRIIYVKSVFNFGSWSTWIYANS